jgi:uridine kinase
MEIYREVIESVKNLMKIKDNVIVAIDGRCGSGKTTLSAILAREFDCNVFHMDDFFLPPQMRTSKRLAEPGGNVHHERFRDEVIAPLLGGRPVCFRPYVCSNMGFGDMNCFERKRLNVVEGSYSLHPSLREAYDLKIFLLLDPLIQEKRILQRSGPLKLKDFKSIWIPMEELYFSELDVAACCDIVIDTSGIL